jgi:predicted RNase H-like nuclease
MARAAKAITTRKPAARGRKPGRPAPVGKTPAKATKPAVVPKRAAIVAPVSTRRTAGRSAVAVVPAKAAVKVIKVAAAPKRAPAAAAPALKLSKDELRVQVEKLERANATLRAKNREAHRTAKAVTARIAELEENVARLAKKAASQTPPANGEQAAKPSRAKRQSRGIADQKPAPLDEEGAAALEEQLRHS